MMPPVNRRLPGASKRRLHLSNQCERPHKKRACGTVLPALPVERCRVLSRASGAALSVEHGRVSAYGDEEAQERASYFALIITRQREVDFERQDIDLCRVPRGSVPYLLGKGGATLRSLEQDSGCVMLFARCHSGQVLCVLSWSALARIRAELAVWAAVDRFSPGAANASYLLRPRPGRYGVEPYDNATLRSDIALIFGSRGATRDKIAKAAACVIQIIGQRCFLAGDDQSRNRGACYLDAFFLQQRSSCHSAVFSLPPDADILGITPDAAAVATADHAAILRQVENATATYCLILPLPKARGQYRHLRDVLVLSHSASNRRQALRLLESRLRSCTGARLSHAATTNSGRITISS